MVWPLLALAGASAFSNYKKGKANEKFSRQQLDVQNREARERWNRENDMYRASVAADMARMRGNVEAGRAGLQSRQDAFGLTKEAEEAEQKQRDQFAKAMVEFGEANKTANLAEAKAKRSGRASKAARGAKVLGTAKRAGRLSGSFRSGAKAAVGAGLQKSAERSGMEAALRGYGADLDRERGLFADLSGEGAVVGEQARRLRDLGRLRTQLGGQEEQALRDQASAAYARDMVGANELGRHPVVQTYGGQPNYGIWGNIGNLANTGMAVYGMGNGGNPFAKPQGQGITYGSGSPFPNRYMGAPLNTGTDRYKHRF